VASRRGSAPSWLYIFIVLILGATLIAGVISWIWLTFENKQLPDGLATVLATIAGGLVGVLTMADGRGGRAGPRDDDPGGAC
jgi:uncharacterized membrane protein AbrB (regulator of aidB expression)